MVKTLNITLDDADYKAAHQVKEELDLTWQEFIVVATDCLQEQV